MSEHTPGPWVFDQRVGCVAVYYGEKANCIHDADPRMLFFRQGVRHCDSSGCHIWSVDAEHVANARLIAAAPELLEKLRKQSETLRRLVDECGADRHLDSQDVTGMRDAEILLARLADREGGR